MSQQPFSRPGAVDLSALKRPAQPAPGSRPASTSGAYSVDLDDQNIQGHLESSMNAPVLMAVYSPSQAPDSARMVDVSRTDENMIPAMLEAVRVEATLGEICDALRAEWGTYREPARF